MVCVFWIAIDNPKLAFSSQLFFNAFQNWADDNTFPVSMSSIPFWTTFCCFTESSSHQSAFDFDFFRPSKNSTTFSSESRLIQAIKSSFFIDFCCSHCCIWFISKATRLIQTEQYQYNLLTFYFQPITSPPTLPFCSSLCWLPAWCKFPKPSIYRVCFRKTYRLPVIRVRLPNGHRAQRSVA